jgi:hypothetical protein
MLVICGKVSNTYYPLSTDEKFSKKHNILYSENQDKPDELSEKMQLNMFAMKHKIEPELEENIKGRYRVFKQTK